MTSDKLTLAVECHQAGRLKEAESLYRQVLEADPACADGWHLLGLLLHQAGQGHVAVEYIHRAIALQPDHVQAHYNLGVLLAGQSQFEPAIRCFRQVIHLQPDFVKAHNNLGVVLEKTERLDEAINSYRQALRYQADYVEALNNLGVALGKQGQFETAIDCLERAVQLKPAYVEAHFNLANKFRAAGHLEQAAARYRQVLQLRPNHTAAHNNLGVILLTQGQLDLAQAQFRQVLKLQPDEAEAHYNLGVVLKEKDEIGPARESYQQALRLKPEKILWKLESEMLCPAMMLTRQAIDRWRQEFEAALDNYPPGSINLTGLLEDIPASKAQPPFALHYQGKNDRRLKSKYAGLFSVADPVSSHASPGRSRDGISMPPPQRYGDASAFSNKLSGGKIRLGFFVSLKNEGLFLKLMGGIIERLNRGEFAVTIIGLPKSLQFIRDRIQSDAIFWLPITLNLKSTIQKIRAAKLDLIYYWEVGSNAVNYFLPFFRLAPAQCTSWGVTETSGVPHIDYYISSRFFEADGAAAHYTETLVQLDTLPVYYTRPELPANPGGRDYFNLPEDAHLYLCLQNRRKFHPDFDPLVARILRHDPAGQLVLVGKKGRTQHDTLWLNRLKTIAPDVVDRVIILPRQNYRDYLNLIAVADVLLDTLYFCGGMTSYDSLAVGTPLVTLPGAFMRGRMTLGCYRQMGVLDCVASGPDEYVDIALRLGTDSLWQNQIRARILSANGVLYENKAVVSAYEDFFRQATLTT